MRAVFLIFLGGALAVGAALPAHSDTRSDALFARARKVVANTRSLQADHVVTLRMGAKSESRTHTLKVLKPHFWEARTDKDERRWQMSDGKYNYSTFERNKQCVKSPVTPGEPKALQFGPAVGALLGEKVLPEEGTHRYLGTQQVGGKSYDVVELTYRKPTGIAPKVKLFFGASALPEGREWNLPMGKGPAVKQMEWLKNLHLDVPLTPEYFAFRTPKGYTLLDIEKPSQP